MFNRLNNSRNKDAFLVRQEANELSNSLPHSDHLNNGEEESYRDSNGRLNYIGNFSKGLRHNRFSEVIPDAYRIMVRALYSTDPILFERRRMMGTLNGLNLTNPQAGLAFDLEGSDPQSFTMPPAPRIDGAENSAEMAELYWMALLRDVNFGDYSAHPLVLEATDSLSNEFSDFKGPIEGVVTPETLFRGFTPADLIGPYVSQFLLKPIPYGTLNIEQHNNVALANINYLTTFPIWRRAQEGISDTDGNSLDDLAENMIAPGELSSLFEPVTRHICTLRDLATYVHFDALYEAYLNACLILLGMPARVDPGNPYIDKPRHRTQRTQDGFGTFGPPHILTLVTEVATRALKAVWFQKWGVHRRLRPEEFGGRIHVHLVEDPGRYSGMINREILDSLSTSPHPVTGVPGKLSAHFPIGTGYLLPQAFKEGAPTHPAYGAGHATVAGACVTVLKAWFDESEVFDPTLVPAVIPGVPGAVRDQMEQNRTVVEPDPLDPTCRTLRDMPNPPILTVGGELNKLAANIALARNAGGVHWRSDYTESLKFGEKIAIRILQEQKLTYNEDHHLSLTKFDGTSITI